MSGRVNILVRDFDDADGDVHYFDLGRASISLDTVVTEGNVMAHTQLVQLPARWYPLQRCRGMKKVRGALKIAVGFIVGSDSNLFLSDDAESGVEQSATDQATLFENKLRKIRRMRENTHGHAASLSPTQRGCASNRILTARGGTVGQRPKSAPAATHLTSPFHERQQPFELKPLEPKFQPSAEVQSATTPSDHRQNKYSNKQNPGAGGIAASIHDAKPRWRDVYGSTERRREIIPPPSASGMVGGTPVMAVPPSLLREKDPSLAKWDVDDPRVVKVRTSTKLSRINVRTASGAMKQQGRSEGAVVSASSGDEGLGVKAHRWYRQLLVTLDRLESSSTQSMAYGELRLIVREASATQVAQVVSASRGVGGSCSLSARRHMLKLLSWLCWDQPRAASKTYPGIITYALDRVRDADSASLRADLAACVSAVALSALRNGTAQACMLQTQRFLDLVREQRAAVRESAGVCCAAAVLPRSPPVSLEVDTDMRSIEDVRLAIGQAAKHIGITSAVPKESVLLPGGLAVIELADAAAALAFHDAMTATSAGLPATWKIFPFPEVRILFQISCSPSCKTLVYLPQKLNFRLIAGLSSIFCWFLQLRVPPATYFCLCTCRARKK